MIRAVSLSLVFALALACKKQAPVTEVAAAPPPAPAAPAPREVSAEVKQLRANFNLVYFDTDKAALGPEALDALQANAAILTANPQISIEIQGHADERGTTDYNLALGQRRAEAVQKALREMGVTGPRRVRVVSFGEEKPAVPGEGAMAWSKNRRCEFRILEGDRSEVKGTVP
jgi:peptidoglycan-associated lipoprotein